MELMMFVKFHCLVLMIRIRGWCQYFGLFSQNHKRVTHIKAVIIFGNYFKRLA